MWSQIRGLFRSRTQFYAIVAASLVLLLLASTYYKLGDRHIETNVVDSHTKLANKGPAIAIHRPSDVEYKDGDRLREKIRNGDRKGREDELKDQDKENVDKKQTLQKTTVHTNDSLQGKTETSTTRRTTTIPAHLLARRTRKPTTLQSYIDKAYNSRQENNTQIVDKINIEPEIKPRQEKELPVVSTNGNDTSKFAMPAISHEKLVELVPQVHTEGANCAKLFEHNQAELDRAKQYQTANPKVKIPDESYSNLASNCDEFKKSRRYITVPLNKEEEEFPIAFSIMMFKDVEQVERLLRAIYRPQNHYCIHVDIKSAPHIQKSMAAIAGCFENVFIASKKIDVQWAWFSVLEPDLLCMEELWKYKKWKYFINLTGQEWPLKTNWDLVKMLKVYNGANDMEGTVKR